MLSYGKEIKNIKRQLAQLILNTARDKRYSEYDIEAGRVNTSRAQRSADDANEKGRENAESIIAAEQTITDMDLQNIETEQTITDKDLRIMELEGKNE